MAKDRSKPKKGMGRRHDGRQWVQVAALPYRLDAGGRLQILLVTSRETRRWVIPKGWPMKGRLDHEAAAIEALEEGGVAGSVSEAPAGTYLYWKRLAEQFALCEVRVFPLRVETVLDVFREREQRGQAWFGQEEAADSVDEPGLCHLIQSFRP